MALIFHIIITVKCRWKKNRSVLDSHAQKDRKCQIKQQIRGEKTILKRELKAFFFLMALLLLKCQLRFLSVPISLRSYFVAIFFYYFLLLLCFCASKKWLKIEFIHFFLYIVDSFVVRGAKLQVIGLEISFALPLPNRTYQREWITNCLRLNIFSLSLTTLFTLLIVCISNTARNGIYARPVAHKVLNGVGGFSPSDIISVFQATSFQCCSDFFFQLLLPLRIVNLESWFHQLLNRMPSQWKKSNNFRLVEVNELQIKAEQ